jgi:hypothetical protein
MVGLRGELKPGPLKSEKECFTFLLPKSPVNKK